MTNVSRIAILSLLSIPATLSAQTVRGVVTEAGSGAPVAGAMIVMVDSTGETIKTSFTDRSGQYRLVTEHAGTYALRVLRIGYQSWESPSFQLAAAEFLDNSLVVPTRAIELAGLLSEAEPQCVVDPEQGVRTAALWEEARKALQATKWTEEQRLFDFTVRRFERQLASDGARVQRQRDWTWTSDENTPFRRRAPEAFAETGYVVVEQVGRRDQWRVHFIVPYPEILLSDVFLRDHCYRVEFDDQSRAMAGLTFTAIEGRDHPQIEGVLWIDIETGALSHLEYSYANLPEDIPSTEVGGRVEFAPLPSGPWIVRSWEVRQPTIRYRPTEFQTRWVRTVVGFLETGGEVVDVQLAGRRFASEDATTMVTGTVFDSTTGSPLVAAAVNIEGTEYTDTTDALGRFTLAGPLDGEYIVSVAHPRVSRLGVDPPFALTTLARGGADTLSLAVPSWGTVLESTCLSSEADAGRGALLGSVLSTVGQGFGSGALVRLFWSEQERTPERIRVTDRRATFQANERGFFVACGLPTDQPIAVHATHGPGRSAVHIVTLDAEQGVSADGPGWRLDLNVGDRLDQTGLLGGVVTSGDATPLMGALVELPALRMNTRTDSTGTFTLGSLPPGDHTMRIRLAGYEPVFVDAVLGLGDTVQLASGELSMRRNPLELEALVVETTAERRPRHIERSGFYERRAEGFGEFVTRDEFETWVPTQMSDVMRRVPGVRVVPNPNVGRALFNQLGISVGSDSRQFLVEMTSRPLNISMSECPPLIFLDGLYMGSTVEVNLDRTVTLGQIEAVEVYRSGSEAPAQFNRTGSACGVIALWTR